MEWRTGRKLAHLKQYFFLDQMKESFFDRAIVVEAKVLSVGVKALVVKCEITKVYCGSKALVGTTFSDYNSKRRGPVPLLVVGETGIWTLVKNKNEIIPASDDSFGGGINRIRKSMEVLHVDYNQYVQLAEEIGSIYHMEPKQRIHKVREDVNSDIPTIAYWAASVFPRFFDGKNVVRVMWDVRKTPLKTVAATLVVSKFLNDWDPEAWNPSKERLEDLQHCVQLKMTNDEGYTLLRDLESEITGGDWVDQKTAVQLLESARDNPSMDDWLKERFSDLLKEYLAKSQGGEKAKKR